MGINRKNCADKAFAGDILGIVFGDKPIVNNIKGRNKMEESGKTVSQSKIETVHLVHPSDMNAVGRLYGGTLM